MPPLYKDDTDLANNRKKNESNNSSSNINRSTGTIGARNRNTSTSGNRSGAGAGAGAGAVSDRSKPNSSPSAAESSLCRPNTNSTSLCLQSRMDTSINTLDSIQSNSNSSSIRSNDDPDDRQDVLDTDPATTTDQITATAAFLSSSLSPPSKHQNNNSVRFAASTLIRPASETSLNNNNNSTSNLRRQYLSWLSWFPWISQYTDSNISAGTTTTTRHRSRRRRGFFQWNETTASGWHMTKLWLFGMMTPIGVVTWTITHRVSAVLASVLVLPSIAILQGSLAILRYRVQFGDSPLPKAPSHGIVKCVSRSKTQDSTNNNNDKNPRLSESKGYGSATTTTTPVKSGFHNSGSLMGESATSFQGFVDPDHDHHPSTIGHTTSPLSPSNDTSTTTPLRLLVIGDSLAIGVGQSKTATPVMPETIARTLSKAMNGRPVLWSCHGAPGASAGWIVRELERSIQQGVFLQANPPYGRAYPGSGDGGGNSNRRDVAVSKTAANDDDDNNGNQTMTKRASFADADSFSSSEDDSSSSDDGNNPIDHNSIRVEENNDEHVEELKTWSDRLKEHRIRFDPNVLGPFDIAVVLTGSNDLKSAFFPFLLTGEDAEFRRQAQQRGGGYGTELTRILQVLNRRMRMRLQTLRESVEAATEMVRESVDNIRERLNSHDLNTPSVEGDIVRANPTTTQRRTTRAAASPNVSSMPGEKQQPCKETTSLLQADEMMEGSSNTNASFHNSPQFPMVVLPGMPARALPIFQTAPLRWLAVPIVDIMDSHKKKLARRHDGEVLFVDAPSCEAIAAYSSHYGVHWEEEEDDRVLLNLRGIKRKQARAIESDMEGYFSKKAQPPKPEELPLRRRHQSMFSVDGIHPNDQGYDFWGRYIAHAIVEEWKRKQMELGTSPDLV